MVRASISCFFCFFFGLVVSSAQEHTADQRSVEAISHPDSLSLRLWADSEQLANPVAFTFEPQGQNVRL